MDSQAKLPLTFLKAKRVFAEIVAIYAVCSRRLLSGQSWLLLFLSQKGSGPVFVSSRVACRKILSKNVKIRLSAHEQFTLVVSQPKQGSKAFDSHSLHEFN